MNEDGLKTNSWEKIICKLKMGPMSRCGNVDKTFKQRGGIRKVKLETNVSELKME